MVLSRLTKSLVAIALLLVVAFALYASVTYPRAVVTIAISFTIGAESKTTPLRQQFLNDKVQVEVSVENGAALWKAQILSGDQVVWTHSAAQGEQQNYNSGWIQLSSGSYNFTFGTIAFGSLNAQVTVASKGGFW